MQGISFELAGCSHWLRRTARAPILIIVLLCQVAARGQQTSSPKPIRDLDEYGDVSCADERAQLNYFAVQIRKIPDAKLYIIYYGGKYPILRTAEFEGRRLPKRGEADARVARMKSWLVDRHKLPPSRIVMINGGFKEWFSWQIWIVEKGDNAPTPSPGFPVKEIKFGSGRARINDYQCLSNK
jgi:hypothetical protein